MYQRGDIVGYGGYVYRAVQNNNNQQPAVSADWSLVTENYNFQGNWVSVNPITLLCKSSSEEG